MAQDKNRMWLMAVQARLEFIEKEIYAFFLLFLPPPFLPRGLNWTMTKKSLTLLLVIFPPSPSNHPSDIRLNVGLLLEFIGQSQMLLYETLVSSNWAGHKAGLSPLPNR